MTLSELYERLSTQLVTINIDQTRLNKVDPARTGTTEQSVCTMRSAGPPVLGSSRYQMPTTG